MSKYSKFFAILKQANKVTGLGLTYQEVVADFTGGRTTSLSQLSVAELTEIELRLSALSRTQGSTRSTDEATKDSMRKAIIAQFLAVDKTVEDAIAWAEKYGVFGQKKPFNDYNKKELWQLIRNAEQAKKDHIAALSRK